MYVPSPAPLVVDAHHHLWDPSLEGEGPWSYGWTRGKGPLDRAWLPDDLAPLMRASGVHQSVLVQTQHHTQENEWALGLASTHPFIAGVVGWLDLGAPDIDEQAERWAARRRFVGVRHVTQDEPDDDWQVRPAVLRGLAALERHGLSYDLLFYAKHLRHAPTVAAHCPGLRLVLDHLSKPPIALGWGHPKQEAWRRELRAAAAHPNLHAKLSGLVTEADPARWTVEDLAPFVRFAIDCFGPERVMFGSDWPVCLLASGYGRWVEAFAQVIAPLAPAERAAIWGGNAARFYRLGKA